MDVFDLQATISLDTGDYEKQLNQATSSTETASDSVGIFDIALGNLAAQGLSSAISKVGEFISSTISLGDDIDKNSQRVGMSTDTYQEWAHVLELGGGSASSLTSATKTLSNVITDAGNGSESAAEKLNSIGLSYEQIAALSPEEQFEAVVYALSDMEDGAARTAAAQDLLGRAGMDLIPTLNSGKGAIEDMRQEAHDLGLVLSKDTVDASASFNDALTNLQGAITGMAGNLAGELMPGLEDIVEGFTQFIAGASSAEEATALISGGVNNLVTTVLNMLTSGIPALANMATTFFSAIVNALPGIITNLAAALPQVITTITTTLTGNVGQISNAAFTALSAIVSAVPQLIDSLLSELPVIIEETATFLTESVPELFDGALTFFMAIVDALPEIVVSLAEALPDILTAIIDFLTGAIPELLENAITFLTAIVDALPTVIANLVNALPQLITALTTFLGDSNNIESVMQSFITLMGALVTAIPQIITSLVQALPDILAAIVTTITSWISSVLTAALDVGKGLVDGIKQGFSNAWDSFISWITSQLGGFVGKVLSIFGIDSPSTVFADIGENLGLGMEEGWDSSFATFQDSALDGMQQFVSSVDEEMGSIDFASSAIEDMRQEAHDLGLVLSEDTVSASASFNDALTNLQGAITGMAGNLAGELMPGLEDIVEGFTQFMAGASSAEEAIALISDGVDNLVTTVLNMLTSGIPALANMATTFFSAIVNALPGIITNLAAALPQVITTVTTALTSSIGQISNAAFTALSAIVSAVPQLIEPLLGELPAIIEETATFLTESVPELLDGALTFFMAIVDALPEIVVSLAEALPDILTAIIDFLTGAIPELLENAITFFMAIVDALPEVITSLMEALPDILTAITEFLTGAIPELLENAITFLTAIVDALPTVIANLVNALPQLITALTTFLGDSNNIESVMQSFITLMGALVTAIPQIITSLVQALPDILTAIVTTITSWVSSVLTAALDIGKGLVDGIKQGFSNAWDSFVSWIMDQLSGLVDKVLGFFGIRSPSTVFADIGENLGLGMEEGWDSSFSAFQDSALDDIQQFVNSANEEMGLVLSKGIVDASTSFNDALTNLQGAITGMEEGWDSSFSAFQDSALDDIQQFVNSANEEMDAIDFTDSAIGQLQNTYGELTSALINQNSTNNRNQQINTTIDLGGTKVAEQIFKLYNDRYEVVGAAAVT